MSVGQKKGRPGFYLGVSLVHMRRIMVPLLMVCHSSLPQTCHGFARIGQRMRAAPSSRSLLFVTNHHLKKHPNNRYSSSSSSSSSLLSSSSTSDAVTSSTSAKTTPTPLVDSGYDVSNKKAGIVGKYEPALFEHPLYKWWEEAGCFQPDAKQAASSNPKQPYVLPMPPPNVTGRLHMGHTMFVALQDVLARFHRMRGRPVLWLPGTDHAGIATQLQVESCSKKRARRDKKWGATSFCAACGCTRPSRADTLHVSCAR